MSETTTETTTETTATPTQFSQADVERIVRDRVARERGKYSDYADLQRKAGELDQIEERDKTELQKVQARAERAERERDETRTAANTRLIRSEARALAAAAKFRNPTLAVALLDLAEVKVDNDGAVDSDTVKRQLDALAKTEPYLIAEETPLSRAGHAGIGVSGGRTPTDPRTADLQQIESDISASNNRRT